MTSNCGMGCGRASLLGRRVLVQGRISWLVGATIVLSALLLAPAATSGTDNIASGSLDRPTGGLPQTGELRLNRTKWKVQVGDSITAQITGVTDPNLQGATHADVVIKSSARGNVTVLGTKSGTTITFSWTVPANACADDGRRLRPRRLEPGRQQLKQRPDPGSVQPAGL